MSQRVPVRPGLVRQRRLKLQALAAEVRRSWPVGDFLPGQVIAYYLVDGGPAAGRGAARRLGEQVVAAARAHGIPVVETTDSPEPLWAL